jgi:PAS domain S-box-containing protein
MRYVAGHVIGASKIARDITESKRVADALRASEARFRTLVETAQSGIWAVDTESRTIFANARMAQILGTTPEALQGRPASEFYLPSDIAEARDRIGKNLAGVAE